MRMINLANFFAKQKVVATSGKPVKLSGYHISSTIAFVEGGVSADTITDSGNNFLLSGFVAGDRIKVSGSTSNDGYYTINTVTAGTITLIASEDLANEGASASVTIQEVNNLSTSPAGTTYTSAGIPVADGVKIVIKALSSNSGTITVGSTSAKALNTSVNNYTLIPMETVEYYLQNINQIWIDSTSSGDKVSITFEI